MKIYFAGTPETKSRAQQWIDIIPKRLISFWNLKEEQMGIWQRELSYEFSLMEKEKV